MICTALVLLLVGGAPKATKSVPSTDPLAELLEVKGFEKFKKLLAENEPKQLWLQIKWTPVHEAQKAGAESKKPILATIKTGSGGKSNAPFT